MKTDGPTLNEMSTVDTTVNVDTEETPRPQISRPISTTSRIRDWFVDSWKQVLIGVVTTAIVSIVGKLVIEHGVHLTRHDKDIEYLQKSDLNQDSDINQLKEKTNNLNTDIRLLEQRVDMEKERTSTTKK